MKGRMSFLISYLLLALCSDAVVVAPPPQRERSPPASCASPAAAPAAPVRSDGSPGEFPINHVNLPSCKARSAKNAQGIAGSGSVELGVQTHFSQGWRIDLLDQARALGSAGIRDEIVWNHVEKSPGGYNFGVSTAAWLKTALAQGTEVTVLFTGGNDLYDAGGTPHTEAALQAYAAFIVATLKEHPGITRIEIGNEFNGNAFVTGAVAKQPLSLRDEAYTAIIAAVDQAIEAAGLDVDIIGGAAHSIPVDWFSDLKAGGAFEHMDAIAIHPYSTRPEQFEDQIALLRLAMGDTQLPIEVTEFGQEFGSLAEAPNYLVKMVSVMAASGIERASWYALAKQQWFPNMELYDPTTGTATPAGKAFAFMDMLLGIGEVTKLAVDDFTYAYAFGVNAMVVWGEPRSISLGAGVNAYDLTGNLITEFSGKIDSITPIVLISDAPITLGGNLSFGESNLLASSFHQFDVSNPVLGSTAGFEGPWSYFVENAATLKRTALQTMGGGLASGESWTPYLGSVWLRPLAVNSTSVNPVDFSNGNTPSLSYRTVERYTAASDQTVTIKGSWDVNDGSADGITLKITRNDATLFEKVIYDPANGHVFDLALSGIQLAKGDFIDFVVGANANAKGNDNTRRTIEIFQESSTEALVSEGLAALPLAPVPTIDEDAIAPMAGLKNVGVTRASIVGSKDGDLIDAAQMQVKMHIKGGSGDDTIFGSDFGNQLEGGSGNDFLRGGVGNDYIIGDAGNDVILGGAGDDYLVGNAGDDVIWGGLGNDRMFGSSGNDRFIFEDNWGADRITGFQAGDVLDFSRVSGVNSMADFSITVNMGYAKLEFAGQSILFEPPTMTLFNEANFIF